jgi:hypothetical protein
MLAHVIKYSTLQHSSNRKFLNFIWFSLKINSTPKRYLTTTFVAHVLCIFLSLRTKFYVLFKAHRPLDVNCLRDRFLLSNAVFHMPSLHITPERMRCSVHNYAVRLMIRSGRWDRERREKKDVPLGGLSSTYVTLRLILLSKENNSSSMSLLSYNLWH